MPLDPFEERAGRLSRAVAENLTAPVRDAALGLIDAVFRWLSRFTLGLLLKSVAAIAAAIFLVIAVVCGCTAAYLALASLVGAAPAFLIIAVLFLALAAVMAGIAVHARMELQPGVAPVPTSGDLVVVAPRVPSEDTAPEPGPTDAAEAGPSVPEPGLRGTAQALATVLGAAGLQRQQAGVEAGLVLADRLTPLQLAIIAAAAAFAQGRDLRGEREGETDG